MSLKHLCKKCSTVPRSNKHGRKRPYTEKYDGLHVIVLRSYISVSYTETYDDIRRKKRSFTVLVHGVSNISDWIE